jgi:ADP-ribose pyrophosphatase YjhB (NUDIX family)
MSYPISVKGVLLIGGKVLLVRNDRAEWELPGGRLEPGETPEQTLAREFERGGRDVLVEGERKVLAPLHLNS